MKIKASMRVKMELDDEEMNLILHALSTHEVHGDHDWPGEGAKASVLREVMLNGMNYYNKRTY